MSEALVDIHRLSVSYGKTDALKDLTLHVNEGDIYGLIGPNGAGKTTAFRVCATILRPRCGRVRIAGMDISHRRRVMEVRRLLGYMPDSFGVYEDMTVEEYLTFFAAAYDIRNPKRRRLVRDVLELVDLEAKRSVLVESLSRGMQQRLGIARVLIHDPKLLILDEPASGLDPRARIEIRGLLMELQRMGKTILISSHILADLGEICNRIGILERGTLRVDGPLDEVLSQLKPSSIVLCRVEDPSGAQDALSALPFVKKVTRGKDALAIEVTDGFDEVWKLTDALVGAGVKVNYIEQESESLERAFIEWTEGGVS